jgi:hypothetical protein
MAKRSGNTVLELAIARGGYRRGFRVATFIEQWTIAQHALGHEPTVIEAADWWKESHATWFRRQVEFREFFAPLENPAPIAALVIREVEARRERIGSVVAALGRIAAEPLLGAAPQAA